MTLPIKLSSRPTGEFWELPVLFEDEHLLALDKPVGLPVSPDRADPERPHLMALLHAGIRAGSAWATSRGLTYLANAHRLDPETPGVLLLAKSKPVLVALANAFGAEKPIQTCVALVQGAPAEEEFAVDVKLAPDERQAGLVRASSRRGKKALTRFHVVERFADHTLLRCQPQTGRAHQIRVHLQHRRLPIVGDKVYGGKPLWLSRLKPNYRLKVGHEERPLISRVALHATDLELTHPVTGLPVKIVSPWPKDLVVAVKYLRKFACPAGAPAAAPI